LPERGEIRRLPHEVVHQFLDHAEEFLTSSPLRQLALAVAAGSFITFGAVLSVALTVDVEPLGISRLLLGLGFSAGFILVILSGSALFTEINVLLPEMFLSRPRDLCRRCWRFWLIAYAGNVLGALFVGSMVNGAHLFGTLQEQRLFEIMAEKVEFQDMGAEGWFVVVVSGILGNWLVGMAAFLATAARTVPGKILGVVFPIVTFVAIGAQHSPANMGYFSVGLIGGGSGIGWGEAIWWSIVPASLGNVVGGAILVALLFWYTYGRDAKGRQSLIRAGELARSQRG
jgi:formate transporter